MSGKLAPSKSTIYVSNLPFLLTNNDLHKIFEKYGKVVKVTILRDKVTRQSKGVAFVLFLERESAYQASKALNDTEMFNRRIKCSIAKDNGRASEFIRRKDYLDKSRCYECGESGHLSYQCPSNLLGEREPPKKKERKRKTKENSNQSDNPNAAGSDSDANEDDPALDSLAAAINFQRQKIEHDSSRYGESFAGMSYTYQDDDEPRRKKYKKDAYFSDEEELDDND